MGKWKLEEEENDLDEEVFAALVKSGYYQKINNCWYIVSPWTFKLWRFSYLHDPEGRDSWRGSIIDKSGRWVRLLGGFYFCLPQVRWLMHPSEICLFSLITDRDLHDYPDSVEGETLHVVDHTCKRCGKRFSI